MAINFIAVPQDHTVIHLHLLHCLTHAMQVYNRLIATGHANLVQQAVMGFPSTSGDLRYAAKTFVPPSGRPVPAPANSADLGTKVPPENLRLNLLKQPLDLRHHQTRQETSPNLIGTDEFFIFNKPGKLGTPLVKNSQSLHLPQFQPSAHPPNTLSAQNPLTQL